MKSLSRSLIVLCVLVYSACEDNQEVQRQEFTVSEAKAWFEENFSTDESTSRADQGAALNSASIKKQVFWDKAMKLNITGVKEGFVIPVWFEDKLRFGKQAIRELWVFKDEKGKLNALLVELMATNEHFTTHSGKINMKNFTGGILFHDWNKGFQGGTFYKDGKAAGYIREYSWHGKNTSKPKSNENARTTDCGYDYAYVENGVVTISWIWQPCPDSGWAYLQYLSQYTYFAEEWVNAQYGCEVQGNCQDSYYQPYYEPQPIGPPSDPLEGDLFVQEMPDGSKRTLMYACFAEGCAWVTVAIDIPPITVYSYREEYSFLPLFPPDKLTISNPNDGFVYRFEANEIMWHGEPIASFLQKMLAENPFLLINIDCDELAKWKDVAIHKAPQQVIDKINKLKDDQSAWSAFIPYNTWDIQYLDEAEGTVVNMDYFSVTITQLPKNDANQTMTPDALLGQIRKNINSFIDPTAADFEPFNEEEFKLWVSNDYLGSIIHIDMENDHTWLGGLNPVEQKEDGSVICTKAQTDQWIFTTIQAPGDGEHPVTGNRQFGFVTNADGTYTFFTRGVDRATGTIDNVVQNYTNAIFSGGDALWSSLQEKIKTYVDSNGGSANFNESNKVIYRPKWDDVVGYYKGTKSLQSLGCK